MRRQTDWQKYPVLFSLYIAQAIPMSFFTTVVPVIMRQENYSLESIGLLQLIKLPWVLKFLWAPMVDNNAGTLAGYKRWIFGSEIFYALVVLSIGLFSLQTNFSLIIILMLLAVTASATQDIAADAFAILILKKRERGYGNSMQSAGGFAGNLIGGGLLLMVFYHLGWHVMMGGLALFVLAALIPLGFYRKAASCKREQLPKVQLADLWGFIRQKGMYKWLIILLMYASGITGIMAMLKPWLVDLNYTTAEIGIRVGIHGTLSALAASLLAGYIVKKAGYRKAMIYFLFFAFLAGLYFWHISKIEAPPSELVMYAVIALWASYGCLMVAVYTGAMDMVRPGKEGTDFTLQIVLTHISGLFISVFSGKLADVFGYSTLFGLQASMSLMALLLLMVFKTLRPTLNKPLKQAFNS